MQFYQVQREIKPGIEEMQKKTSPTQVGAVSVPGQEGWCPGRGWGDRKGFWGWHGSPP